MDKVNPSPMKPYTSIAVASSFSDSALNIPQKGASLFTSAPGSHRDYPPGHSKVVSVG